MKRIPALFVITVFVFLLSSCKLLLPDVRLRSEKKDIVESKYGNLEYVVEGILVYKNLEDQFKDIDGIDYIIENAGNRGSIAPELKENLLLIVDIVKQDDTYKLLVYNDVMKRNKDKEKMFILTDYMLPVDMNEVETFFKDKDDAFSLMDLTVDYFKKDSSLEGNISFMDEIMIAFYNKLAEGEIMVTCYHDESGNILIKSGTSLLFGNSEDKIIYYPSDIIYEDYIN